MECVQSLGFQHPSQSAALFCDCQGDTDFGTTQILPGKSNHCTRELGISMMSKAQHLKKAPSAMLATASVISTCFKALQSLSK